MLSLRVAVKCSVLLRWSTSWQLIEATDRNGSSSWQLGLGSKNGMQHRFVWRNVFDKILFVGTDLLPCNSKFRLCCFFVLYRFCRSTVIVADMGRLLVVFILLIPVYWDCGWDGGSSVCCRPRVSASSRSNMMTPIDALDWWRRFLVSDSGKKICTLLYLS